MIFEYSYWWILPVFLLSLAVAYLKFRKLSKLPDIAFGMILLISTLRFLVIFTLLLLLLNPALSLLHKIKEKPILMIAQDNSASLLENKDSLYYKNEYRKSLNETVARLEDKFEIIRLTFGANVKQDGEINFSEKRTDIAAVIDYARQSSMLRQPIGMILLTDGIYNAGVNPRYKIPAFPVYTVALGDTTCYPDVYVRNIEADKFNFLHTVFPIKAEIAALKQKGEKIKCTLRENGNIVAEQILTIDNDNYLSDLIFQVEAKQQGIIRYSVTAETEFSERSRENNRADTWMNIIDNSGHIAIYSTAPHPDVAAIVGAVNVSGIYRCTEHSFDQASDTLKMNLLILHNPDPLNPAYQKIVEQATKRKISIWYILTNRKSITDFARYSNHYSVDFGTELNEYATPAMNRDFPFFEFTDQEISGFSAYPPLTIPFGEIRTGAGRMLFTQEIKNTPTSNGMLGFYNVNGCRIGYFWGEGLWRWRLYSYSENGNHELFNTFINKIVGYLATQQGGERFVHNIKPLYDETEDAIINVELYNDSYELVNTPDVKLELKYQEKQFDYLLSRNENKYRINLGNLSAGEYTYKLSTHLKGKAFEKKGVFYVRSHNPEWNDIVANRQLLREISDNSKGTLMEMNELDQLVKVLNENDQLKTVYKSENVFIELSGMKIVGLILLLLLCTEWFLLKFFVG
ncbi:MAG: hypothetical protein RSA53_07250 [Odoribacter sp.]